ncbi:MAG TPA: MarR family transcriptional regulator [Hyphomicrobiales bacterium]|nr:MarR family transcriptional regulator [Hyphomicrobiales bacterium]
MASPLPQRSSQREPQSSSQGTEAARNYVLEEQAGFILRQVQQRHTAIFTNRMDNDITPTQWAALAKLYERGPSSQNLLGRLTAMDAATIKGVVDRLVRRGFADTRPDGANRKRLLVELTPQGRQFVEQAAAIAHAITEETLAPLSEKERETLLALLRKMR